MGIRGRTAVTVTVIIGVSGLLAACSSSQPHSAPSSPHSESATTTAKVGSFWVQEPVDAGSRPHASGTANGILGHLVSYTVAADDRMGDIADRFGLKAAYLADLNAVRRQDPTLYVGDVINLSSTHITTIGSENGVEYSNPGPVPMPTQRPADQP